MISRSRKRASSITDAREALHQACELEHQRQAHDGIVQQRPDAGAVGEDDVALQERALRGRDARLRQQAEAGVDAVGGRLAGGEPADAARALRRPLAALQDRWPRSRGLRRRGAARPGAARGRRASGCRGGPSLYLSGAHHGAARVETDPVTELLDGAGHSRPRSRRPCRRRGCRARCPSPSACAAWRVTPSERLLGGEPEQPRGHAHRQQQRGARARSPGCSRSPPRCGRRRRAGPRPAACASSARQ